MITFVNVCSCIESIFTSPLCALEQEERGEEGPGMGGAWRGILGYSVDCVILQQILSPLLSTSVEEIY